MEAAGKEQEPFGSSVRRGRSGRPPSGDADFVPLSYHQDFLALLYGVDKATICRSLARIEKLSGRILGVKHKVMVNEEPIIAARWSTCMNYTPENKAAHLKACIGNDIRNLNSCRKVRSLYERKIKEAAGGAFPLGYTILDCALAETLIAEEKERMAEVLMPPALFAY